MAIGDVAGGLGRGLVAGFVGTAAITASQAIEMKVRGREPSTTPAQAGAEVLGVEPKGEDEQKRFATVMHWAYGTAWGPVRAALRSIGLPPKAATAAHLAAVQGTAMVMLPSLDVAPPVRDWGGTEIADEALHHTVYAIAAGLTYDFLRRRSRAAAAA
jgi:hypothetical protein